MALVAGKRKLRALSQLENVDGNVDGFTHWIGVRGQHGCELVHAVVCYESSGSPETAAPRPYRPARSELLPYDLGRAWRIAEGY